MKRNILQYSHKAEQREENDGRRCLNSTGACQSSLQREVTAKRRSCGPQVRGAQEPKYVKPHIQNSEEK